MKSWWSPAPCVPFPEAWKDLPGLNIAVSIDGLQPEHDKRRTPATYDRILKHIAPHNVTIHCTVTRQQIQRDGYIEEFAKFWSERTGVKKIWFSLYTPQEGEISDERLTPQDRARVLSELRILRTKYPLVDMPERVLNGYKNPPTSPTECIFSQTTECVSSDFSTPIAPCQFGGNPVCTECGCFASAGLAAFGRYKLGGVVSIGSLFSASRKLGARMAGVEA